MSGKSILIIFALLLGAKGHPAWAKGVPYGCKPFAQEFYGWYVPIALDDSRNAPASSYAISKRPESFSPELLKALKADASAEEKARGSSVGLDFDPFLNSQDPSAEYLVRDANIKGDICRINVASRGPDSQGVSLSADLRWSGGKWTFVNLYYPDEGKPEKWDLLGILKELRDGRDRYETEYLAAVKSADNNSPEGFLRLYKIASEGDSAELSESARDKLCLLLYTKTGLWLKVFSGVEQAKFRNYLKRGGLATLEYPKGIDSEDEFYKLVLVRLSKHRAAGKERELLTYLIGMLKEEESK